MNQRSVRVAFAPLLAALLLTLGLSAYIGLTSGWVYGPEIRMETYPTLARGLGAVLGAAVVGLIVVAHSLRAQQDQLEQRLMRWLEGRGGWVADAWDAETEAAVAEQAHVAEDPEGTVEVEVALGERHRLIQLRRHAARLFAVPIVALALIVGLALWAVPASGSFLGNVPILNTSLLLFASYGTLVALGALLVATVVALRE